ncbi:hypothetical protein CerSpe_078060 [Prunus speciosa]
MGWSEQYLSQAGKEVLIKAVAMAMPNFAMSCFKLPINLCKEIEREIIHYWWKGHKEHKGIHWVGWQRLCLMKEAGGMGFRDLRCFNLAMLAKIGWRIIKHPDSLLATTFRDKYFRSSDFMRAVAGRGSSWGWKGIVEGRKILEAGMRWRIGNGQKVRICLDKWVPKPSTFKIYSRHPDMPILVQGLIDDQTQMWNRDLILRCFSCVEAQTILSLPLSRWGCDDKLVWHFTAHGGYTVRTGYELALNLRKNGELGWKAEGDCSHGNDQKKFWRNIWRLQVPPKLRAFVWRGCRNALAVKGNLRRRSVDVDNTCALCGHEGESQVHLFFRCEHARVFWFGSSLQLDVLQLVGEEFSECWESILKKYENHLNYQEILQVVVFGLWCLWKTRNSAVFEGIVTDPTTMVRCLQAQVQEYRAALMSAKPLINELPRPPDPAQSGPALWTKPAHGWVKANCDEAWLQQTHRGGAGWVIRDTYGWLVQAGGVGGLRGSMALMMEAEAIREALIACIKGRLVYVEVESNSLQMIQMIRGERQVDVAVEAIVFDIKMLAGKLQQVVFMATPRQCNKAAHEVAAFVSRVGGNHVWDQVWPEWIFDILASDVNLAIRL